MKWIVAIVLMAELFASAWLAEQIFLYQTTIPERLQPALYCILFGGVGGCVYCLRGVYLSSSVRDQWSNKWLIWYFIRPVVSSVVGGISFLFVNSGLLLLGAAKNPDASQLGMWAVAFLAGLNVDRFIEKFEGIGKSIWGVEPSRQSRSEQKSISTMGDKQ
jgi:hypothetical protein